MITLRAGDLRGGHEVADDQCEQAGREHGHDPAGAPEDADQREAGDHEVAEHLVHQAPQGAVENRSSGHFPVRRVEQKPRDPVLPDRDGDVVHHVAERATRLAEQAGQAAALDQRDDRGEDERRDDQAHPQPGQDPQTAVPQVAGERHPARAARDQEPGDREEAQDADLAERGLPVREPATRILLAVTQRQGMGDQDREGEQQAKETETVLRPREG